MTGAATSAHESAARHVGKAAQVRLVAYPLLRLNITSFAIASTLFATISALITVISALIVRAGMGRAVGSRVRLGRYEREAKSQCRCRRRRPVQSETRARR
jgi:hypothetical protein